MRIPRVVIAGTGSGVGKTSISIGLARAFSRKGVNVQTFKTGPDYLDPTYLSMASGKPCYNLDSWMMGGEYVKTMFLEKSRGADISVIEGVMGFFDGASPDNSEGSTAEISRLLDAPVILVVNAGGIARSIAAIVKGYAELESGINVVGVIANSCGSEGHGEWLKEALASEKLPPLIGTVPKGAFNSLKSRHLGLFAAEYDGISESAIDDIADVIERFVSLDTIRELAGSAPETSGQLPAASEEKSDCGARIGVAMDSAFHFYYRDNLDLMRKLGCSIEEFSPIGDKKIPDGLNGLYIGGGYPEEHAKALSGNVEMISSIKEFAESGCPIYAECGGLIYLCRDVTVLDGTVYPMAGILPFGVKMLDKIKRLGYVEVELAKDTLWGRGGDVARGHEFHYSEMTGEPDSSEGWEKAYLMKHRRSSAPVREGYVKGNILASYAHLHLASKPELLRRFVDTCISGQCNSSGQGE